MKFDMEKTLEAYANNRCNVSATCSAVGISRMHFYRMRKKNKKFAEGLDEIYEALLDGAESKLISKIDDGDITALIFFLKTKGKKRGYVERKEVDQKVEVEPVQIYLPDNGRED